MYNLCGKKVIYYMKWDALTLAFGTFPLFFTFRLLEFGFLLQILSVCILKLVNYSKVGALSRILLSLGKSIEQPKCADYFLKSMPKLGRVGGRHQQYRHYMHTIVDP
jgi:hypothetical protein